MHIEYGRIIVSRSSTLCWGLHPDMQEPCFLWEEFLRRQKIIIRWPHESVGKKGCDWENFCHYKGQKRHSNQLKQKMGMSFSYHERSKGSGSLCAQMYQGFQWGQQDSFSSSLGSACFGVASFSDKPFLHQAKMAVGSSKLKMCLQRQRKREAESFLRVLGSLGKSCDWAGTLVSTGCLCCGDSRSSLDLSSPVWVLLTLYDKCVLLVFRHSGWWTLYCFVAAPSGTYDFLYSYSMTTNGGPGPAWPLSFPLPSYGWD